MRTDELLKLQLPARGIDRGYGTLAGAFHRLVHPIRTKKTEVVGFRGSRRISGLGFD